MATPRIAAAFMSQEQEYQVLMGEATRKAAREHGFDIDVFFAGNTAIDQVQQLTALLRAPAELRPAAIVIETVTGEGLERIARQAAEAGIAWFLINRRVPYIDQLRREFPRIPICSVSTDHLEIGRIQGRQLQTLLAESGTVLYLQGRADTNAARERLAGTREVLGDTVSLRVYVGEWTHAGGRRVAEGWLRAQTGASSRPLAVAAQNDLMAKGAREAFLELRPEWARIPFLGCDGLPQGGQRQVASRQLAATVVNPTDAGGRAVALFAGWLKSGTIPPAEILLRPESFPSMEDLALTGRG
jgi:ribose transport system substrate-binding protein